MVAAAVVGLIATTGTPAAACSPCPSLTAEEKERLADVIVEGVVTDLDRPGWFRDGWVATVRVEGALKAYAGGTLRMNTAGPDPVCGFALREGYRYRLYLTEIGGELEALPCGGTTALSREPVLPWWRISDESLLALAGFLLSNVLAAAALRSPRRRRSHDPRSAGRTRPARSAPSM
ncbi:hypothetical protein Val02_40410 [Virgisporangium aliadipatigenens]|uniref:Tissue inhibitor of metalloproteinase n=1 Tax=Virgisporangium aliadipatigenens TaxID=741659 RepID=A0A8J4DQL3_9ACTN|nr:hypothetical protein [Virgisporangium aliadipatigenens]GIJ47155.1 hypothetical protein Val02_40410 [Virgisporangium aliadipatigenens]